MKVKDLIDLLSSVSPDKDLFFTVRGHDFGGDIGEFPLSFVLLRETGEFDIELLFEDN